MTSPHQEVSQSTKTCKRGHVHPAHENWCGTCRRAAMAKRRDELRAKSNERNRNNRERAVYDNMRKRCLNPTDDHYAEYGGRGIKICDRWLGIGGYRNFLADMGKRPTLGHTIDRIDNEGNYEPNNCKWSTRSEQQKNTRRTHWITHNGETLCLSDWASRYGMIPPVLTSRLKLGWSMERALSTPVAKHGSNLIDRWRKP